MINILAKTLGQTWCIFNDIICPTFMIFFYFITMYESGIATFPERKPWILRILRYSEIFKENTEFEYRQA